MTEIVPASEQGDPPSDLRLRVEHALGKRSTVWTRPETGLSAAHRFVVTFQDGLRIFVKAATTPKTAAQLRNERVALTHVGELAPAVVGWLDDAEFPVLLTEALNGHWPASHAGTEWRPGDLDCVFEAISRLRAIDPLAALAPPPILETTDWPGVAGRIAGSVMESVASAGWFERHAPALAEAEAGLDRTGTTFVHGDVRSDNICLMPDGARFVDWSSAHAGSAEADLALFLPAACLEGGPAPFAVFPHGGQWAAAQGGATLRYALDEAAPAWLRRVARWLTAINLDWAVESLGLEPRDGRKREKQ